MARATAAAAVKVVRAVNKVVRAMLRAALQVAGVVLVVALPLVVLLVVPLVDRLLLVKRLRAPWASVILAARVALLLPVLTPATSAIQAQPRMASPG